MLLSIIVPVYNVEKYLNRCVDSLLDQGEFKDYEIILVDDGSTDSSGKICDDYSDRFDTVRTIHKKNGGLSSARNAGIKSSNGCYVMFVDSDDYIKTNSIGILLDKIICNQLDILIYNFSYIYGKYDVEENNRFLKNYDKIVSGASYLIDNLKSDTMHMMACNKIYNKKLIVDNNILFREGYVHEDEEWTPRILSISKRVMQTEFIVYGYCIRKDSISNNQNRRKASLDLIDNCIQLSDFCRQIENAELQYYLENNTAMLCLSAFYNGHLKDKESQVIDICDNLKLDNRNRKKYLILKSNPSIYLLLNYLYKNIVKLITNLKKIPNKINAVRSILSAKIHKLLRNFFVLKKQRKELRNHYFSIISSSCNGGVITSELGEQFRSPTINLWFEAKDFVKLLENLKYYMELDIQEVENNFCNYPVGRIDDIFIYFMHYSTFEDARKKWNERKLRINYDNIFILMVDKDGCNEEIIKRFDKLQYKNKIIFTAKEYPDIKSSVLAKKYIINNEVGILTDFVGLTGRKYDEYLDYVSWLNNYSDN